AINLSCGSSERTSPFRHLPLVYGGLTTAFDRRDTMNTQRLLSIFSRQNAAPFTFFFFLIVVAVFGFTHSSATAGGGSGQGNQRPLMPSDEELKKDFDDEDLKTKDDKPAGKWSYTTLLDSKLDDPSVPAYVRGIQIVSGGGKYQGINKIKRVQIRNRTSLTIVSVQVRVEVVYKDEPRQGLTGGSIT